MPTIVTFRDGIEEKLKAAGFELSQLKQDLEQYFATKALKKRIRASYLGRDVPFTRPSTIMDAEVHHIHIFVKGITCPQEWAQKYTPTSDSYIVYTFGSIESNAYHVLDFIDNDAHGKCELPDNYSRLTTYKFEADKFRMKF
ncbi:MAG: type II toxin-antitoxin system YafO family toxin [Shewanella oncorhynchi]